MFGFDEPGTASTLRVSVSRRRQFKSRQFRSLGLRSLSRVVHRRHRALVRRDSRSARSLIRLTLREPGPCGTLVASQLLGRPIQNKTETFRTNARWPADKSFLFHTVAICHRHTIDGDDILADWPAFAVPAAKLNSHDTLEQPPARCRNHCGSRRLQRLR